MFSFFRVTILDETEMDVVVGRGCPHYGAAQMKAVKINV
jgi:hypothetical protein